LNGLIIIVVYLKQLYISSSVDSLYWADHFWFCIVSFTPFLYLQLLGQIYRKKPCPY